MDRELRFRTPTFPGRGRGASGRALIEELRRRVIAQYQVALRAACSQPARRQDFGGVVRSAMALVLLLVLLEMRPGTRLGSKPNLEATAGQRAAAVCSIVYGRMTQTLTNVDGVKLPNRLRPNLLGRFRSTHAAVGRSLYAALRARTLAESGEDAELLPKLYDEISQQARLTRN